MNNDMQNSPYFLCHYGVPGRSGKKGAGYWYRNGELTRAGYEHYYGVNASARKREKPGIKLRQKSQNEPVSTISKINKILSTPKYANGRVERPESSTWKSKDASKLSDAELNRRNSRLQREQQYRNMTKSNKRKAAEWIGKTAGTILVATAIGVLKGKATQAYREKWDKYAPKAIAFIKRKGASIAAASVMKNSIKNFARR